MNILISMNNLISFITILIFLHCAVGLPDPVLDQNGDKVQVGASYYLRPIESSNVGGVSALPNTTCIFALIQIPQGNGIPVSFTPVKPEVGSVILESTDINVMFDLAITCASTVWRVDDYDGSTGQYFIWTGGVPGNPGSESAISSWFKIQKHGLGYKLTFCPTSVTKFCIMICRDVGVFLHGGFSRLALSDSPYVFTLEKI